MNVTMNLYYTGKNGAAQAFAAEMEQSGLAARIRGKSGCVKYEYFTSFADCETVLLIDSWSNQAALDAHHASAEMQELAALREKYDLHMSAERYAAVEQQEADNRFIRE